MKEPLKFLVVWLVFATAISVSRVKSPPIMLPREAHNTVGDIPISEQFDDGYISPVQEKPKDVKETPYIFSSPNSVMAVSTSSVLVSFQTARKRLYSEPMVSRDFSYYAD